MIAELSELSHYATIALAIGTTAIGVGLGEGIASYAALDAMDIQPSARSDIAHASIVGMALIETSAIIGITVAIILLLDTQSAAKTIYTGIAELGIAFSICFSGFALGLVSAMPARQAVYAIARQPFFNQKIFTFMILTQSIIQTPIVFGFIIAMFIKGQAATASSLAESIRLIASGLCVGIGSIGPAIGLAHFAQTACKSIGYNRHAYNKLLSFTFISEAIIETPLIFCLIISLLLLSFNVPDNNMLTAYAMLASAFCMGFGTLGAGIGSGKTAAAACEQLAVNPAHYTMLSRLSLFAQGLIDTNVIYALLISLLLLIYR